MTAIEAFRTETAGIGERLEFARMRLGQCLADTHVGADEYLTAMCGFINVYQESRFGAGARSRFASYDDVAADLSAQVGLVTERSGYTFDVRQRIEEYRGDERSAEFRQQGYSEVPRVVTLTLADMIDDHVPTATARRWHREGA